MGFNELIYPVYFNLRRAGICMNKNAHFWERGAGEAECCHIGLRGERKLTGTQEREASIQSHAYLFPGWEAG